MELSKNIAGKLLDNNAVKISVEPPFKWTSGILSPIYCDNRVLISDFSAVKMITEGFRELILKENLEFDVVAGTATAGIPWASFLAYDMEKPMVYIRPEPKGHGAGKQVEGRVEKGQKVLLVEDLISTGGSVLEAVAAAEREGADVLGVVAIFTYELEKANRKFADAGVKLATLTTYSELIEIAKETGYVTKEELELLKKFKENQETWQN